jgi:filamentous hemagglutinin
MCYPASRRYDDSTKLPEDVSGCLSRKTEAIKGRDPFTLPPNKSVVDAMDTPQIKNMVGCSGTDCSDIASKLLDASGGKGKIIEVRPSTIGNLNVYENGVTEPGQFYHQVYTDGRYVYDPRLSSSPIPKGDWEQHIKNINPEGVTVLDKPKGLR